MKACEQIHKVQVVINTQSAKVLLLQLESGCFLLLYILLLSIASVANKNIQCGGSSCA